MNRIDKLIHDDKYVMCMKKIRSAEKDRRFCRHDLSHSMDVARISYILDMEENLGFDKSVVYAMALLHDIGRCEEYENRVSHHRAGAELARDILIRCGYDETDTEAICSAIEQHKGPGDDDSERSLSNLLYRADKLSRNCFDCVAYDECYWTENKKNRGIVI